MLLRKLAYFDLQVLKSKLTVKIGILFMKQTFLEKRIDGAKMIDQVCKKAVSEICFVEGRWGRVEWWGAGEGRHKKWYDKMVR